jgi:RNA polymerase sigma-32 factor
MTAAYARTRDPALGRDIAERNLRLVIALATRYSHRSSIPLEDLVQEGTLGLMEAVERFDPGRGVRFAGYATWWIRAYLLKHLIGNVRIVRPGRTRSDRHDFFHGKLPAADISLSTIAHGDRGDALLDTLPDLSRAPADQTVEIRELAERVRDRAERFGETLQEREAAVFRERVIGEHDSSLRGLATRFRVSRERIRQIEKRLEQTFRAYALSA